MALKFIVTDTLNNSLFMVGTVKMIVERLDAPEPNVRMAISKGHKLLYRYTIKPL